MKTYVVGGAVRDALLGLPVQDHDHVVVGATPEQMQKLGYTPVGKDFPVFLHPRTHEEYALARTERKTAPGYKGFVFHADAGVTLEQDLVRRDLTINAMARDDSGAIIDPFGGRRDLEARIFRHVSPAFAEDPVRILRLARFAARFAGFSVAPETSALMRAMVEAGEVDALVPERVWQELSRGLMESRPSRMFAVLHGCGALARILPEVDAAFAGKEAHGADAAPVMAMVDQAALRGRSLPVRVAVMLHDPGTDAAAAMVKAEQACKRLKIPNDCRDLALLAAREAGSIARAADMQAADMVALLERCDAFRKPQRFDELLDAAHCMHVAAPATAARLRAALHAAQAVRAGEVARLHAGQPQRIAQAIHAARVAAVAALPVVRDS